MSTRCQVKVKSSGLPWDGEEITLYHHSDGYPTNILPLLAKAYEMGLAIPKWAKKMDEPLRYVQAWMLGREGKSASYICASDPGHFEPEPDGELHSDIEYLYVVECQNKDGGSMDEKSPKWNVRVYVPTEGFWDAANMDHMREVAHGEVIALAKQAKKIEKEVAA